MKRLVYKLLILTVAVYGVVVGVNYIVDPANIYHGGIINTMVEYLNDDKIVMISANFDEGAFQEKRIDTMAWKPETVIIGSSHVMYIPFKYEHTYNAGMSGAYLGDYYSIIGLLERFDKMPKRVIIGVDPWAFMRGVDNGRHTSVNKYALCLQDNMEYFGENIQEKQFISERVKEMFSFSYFQASVDFYMKNGIKKSEENVLYTYDSQVSDMSKILADGRRIPASKTYHSVSETNQEIDKLLEKGQVYQLGTGFRGIQKDNVKQFEVLLKYLQDTGVEVHIYLPAWHPRIYEYFCDNDAFAGVDKIEWAMRKIGHEYNIPVHGGYNPSLCGITDNDFMDWLHLKPEKMLENYDFILDDR